jgi:hypothetical protein
VAFLPFVGAVLITAVGIDLAVVRVYSSQIYAVGSFGAKWDVWFDARVCPLRSGAAYVWTGDARGAFHGPAMA